MDLTPSDLARLRIPLSALPGFDPVGLWVYHSRTSFIGSIALGHGLDIGIIPKPRGEDPLGQPVIVDLPATACLDLSDSSTRDRVARWVAGRRGHTIGCIAPSWWFDWGDEMWFLGATAVACVRPAHENGKCNDGHIAIYLPFNDARLLPDGSRWVDAAALAEVAKHVGGGWRRVGVGGGGE